MGRVSRQVPVRIGNKLKRIREELGLSQNEMVKHLGFSDEDGLYRSSISGYELGLRMPPYNILIAYAKLANVYLEVLVDDELDLPLEEMPFKVKSEGIPRLFG